MGQTLKSKMKLSIIVVLLTFALAIEAKPPTLFSTVTGRQAKPPTFFSTVTGRQLQERFSLSADERALEEMARNIRELCTKVNKAYCQGLLARLATSEDRTVVEDENRHRRRVPVVIPLTGDRTVMEDETRKWRATHKSKCNGGKCQFGG